VHTLTCAHLALCVVVVDAAPPCFRHMSLKTDLQINVFIMTRECRPSITGWRRMHVCGGYY
jgi:hypothetical protein